MKPASSGSSILFGMLAGLGVYAMVIADAWGASPIMAYGVRGEVLGLLGVLSLTAGRGDELGLSGWRLVTHGLGFGPGPAGHAMEHHDLRGVGFACLGLMAVVVIALGRMRLVAEQRRLELARRLIERGFEPPTGLLIASVRRDLRRGIVLIFTGLGLVVAGVILTDRGMAAGGLIPAFIGVGYLVSVRLTTGEEPDAEDKELE